MRLLIFLGLIYLAYRVVKSKLARLGFGSQAVQGSGFQEIDRSMVKDPVCGVYVDRSQAIRVEHNGEAHFFCSKACKDQFTHSHQ